MEKRYTFNIESRTEMGDEPVTVFVVTAAWRHRIYQTMELDRFFVMVGADEAYLFHTDGTRVDLEDAEDSDDDSGFYGQLINFLGDTD